ncbi:diaminopimelate epimerase [Kineosporia sp. R_H_3]|uniref:diaminopimelate epimerase n=1 Tax=Kineosporia sp. R_H_3 TaxID=1961848 RepID=UPI001E569F1B|nr:diaminopimelate epimerase [Kineosporia sp. R_H_3]
MSTPSVTGPVVDLLPDGDPLAGHLPVAKGHGTENDFVLVPDPDGRVDLPPALVAALCDRRAGLGGDGLIRVVRCAALPEGVALAGDAEWFMDYRNGDGSVAEMCGNGIRVFVRYLQHLGLVDLADGGTLPVGTRAGLLSVRRDGDLLAADLGAWRVVGGAQAVGAGSDATVEVRGIEATAPDGTLATVPLPGLSIDVGNPHTVVALGSLDLLGGADLTRAPHVTPVPSAGTNVEITVPLHESGSDVGHLRMRVHERGVGETRSCGTGAAAAVLATRAWAGPAAPRVWTVDVPGGRLRVTVPADDVLAGPAVELAGPARIVAEGSLDPAWLAAARAASA